MSKIKQNPPPKKFKISENKKNGPYAEQEHPFTYYWRPAMAWSYMAICLFDFIIAPTGTAMLITFYQSTIPVWKSLTLENGGIIHVAFGAILGVAAWGRTKESVINTEASVGFGPGFGGQSYNESTYTREEYQVGNPRRVVQQRRDVPVENVPVQVKQPIKQYPQPTEELYDTMRLDGTDIRIENEEAKK